jgi:hypothetical protein
MRQNPPAARSPLAEDPSHSQEPARSRLGAKVTGHPADLLAVRRKTMDQMHTPNVEDEKMRRWDDYIDIDLQSKYVLLIFTMCHNVSYIRDITWYTFRSSSSSYIYNIHIYTYYYIPVAWTGHEQFFAGSPGASAPRKTGALGSCGSGAVGPPRKTGGLSHPSHNSWWLGSWFQVWNNPIFFKQQRITYCNQKWQKNTTFWMSYISSHKSSWNLNVSCRIWAGDL